MARAGKDTYANVLNANITTAGTTVVNVEVNTGVSLGEGKGMLIDQIDYSYGGSVMGDFVTGGSSTYLYTAWSVNSVAAADFSADNSRIFHLVEKGRYDMGTAGNAVIHTDPECYQFFPPMIIASPKIYINCVGSAAVSGGVLSSRIYYRYVDLSSQEYLELAESFVLIG